MDNNLNKKLMAVALEYGYNHFNPAGSLDGVDYYSLEYLGDDGAPVPMGLPFLVGVKAGRLSRVQGTAALTLLGRLLGDE